MNARPEVRKDFQQNQKMEGDRSKKRGGRSFLNQEQDMEEVNFTNKSRGGRGFLITLAVGGIGFSQQEQHQRWKFKQKTRTREGRGFSSPTRAELEKAS